MDIATFFAAAFEKLSAIHPGDAYDMMEHELSQYAASSFKKSKGDHPIDLGSGPIAAVKTRTLNLADEGEDPDDSTCIISHSEYPDGSQIIRTQYVQVDLLRTPDGKTLKLDCSQ